MKRASAVVGRFAVKLLRPAFVLFAGMLVVWGLLYFGFELLLHAAHQSLQSHPHPTSDYAEAVIRFKRIQNKEGPELNPVRRSILLTQGIRTERAVVFFHGYTNCPQQFNELGHLFYDLGYNVLIPQLPRHRIADRKVENLSQLKAEELRDCADTSVDIACGLGQKVYISGLSAGGTLSAWIAQNRIEVTRAVLINRSGSGVLAARGHAFTKRARITAAIAPGYPN
jgi:poly(3-hydroxybutyrate) depolymerase